MKTNADVPFNWYQQKQLFLKELRETLRDRRTIVTLLAMPLLLYPLLGIGFRFLTNSQLANDQQEFFIVSQTEEELTTFQSILVDGRQRLPDDSTENLQLDQLKFALVDPSEVTLMQRAQDWNDIGIRVEKRIGFSSNQNSAAPYGPYEIELIFNEDSPLSRQRAQSIQACLQASQDYWVWDQLQGLNPRLQRPLLINTTRVRPPPGPSPVLGLLPLVLLMMTVTGGVYPAIDLTAGERERNTMETLMSLPVPAFRLLIAKYGAVVTVTLLTGVMNLMAMGITLYSLQLVNPLFGETGFGLSLIARLFLMLTVFALFYSAVLLMITSSAKSFKEAQAYLIPLLLISLAPGLVIVLPGWNLTVATAVIPLVNILLLGRELMEGSATPLPALVAGIATVLYAATALSLAAKTFGDDSLASEGQGIRELLQPPQEKQSSPSFALAMMGLAILVPLYFWASGFLGAATWVQSAAARLIVSGMLTLLLFAGLPALLMMVRRVSLNTGFRLQPPGWLSVAGAVLLGISVWPLVFEAVIYSRSWGLGTDLQELLKEGEIATKAQTLLEQFQRVPLWLIIVTLGIIPGICEECFFRGFLFSGLRKLVSPSITILVAAILFGLFHVVMAGGLAVDRVLPSTLLGLLLGWISYRSGSLIPAIVMHATHNSLLLSMVNYREQFLVPMLGDTKSNHLPISWLIVAVLIAATGAILIGLGRKKTEPSAHK